MFALTTANLKCAVEVEVESEMLRRICRCAKATGDSALLTEIRSYVSIPADVEGVARLTSGGTVTYR